MYGERRPAQVDWLMEPAHPDNLHYQHPATITIKNILVIRGILTEHGDSLQQKKSLFWMWDDVALLWIAYDQHEFPSVFFKTKKSPGVYARGGSVEVTTDD